MSVERESRSAPESREENRKRANRYLLEAFAAVWDECPEMRFGQLVMNLSRDSSGFADTWEWKHGTWYDHIDAFYKDWASHVS